MRFRVTIETIDIYKDKLYWLKVWRLRREENKHRLNDYVKRIMFGE